jgi:dihydrodipicolinate synthase/N-acetylneuraminate lyase
MARTPRELKLSGVFASAITPHRANTPEADFSGSLDLLDFLAEGGVSGISILDPVGEFFDYSLEDRQRLVYLGVKRSRVPLIADVSHSTLSGAVHLADEAVSSGADGLLIMPPYFFRYGQAELAEFLCQFAEETSDAVPILLHNQPQHASGLETDTIARLAKTGRFAGIVDSSGDRAFFEQLLALKPGFAVLCGDDRLALEALRAGANALVSPAAGAVPELVVALACGKASAVPLLGEFLTWVERFPAPAGIKRAVELRGQKSGGSFIPLAPETARALDEFSAWFKAWLPNMKKVIRNG